MTSKNYLTKSYTEGRSPGGRASREDVYQTTALCVIADALQILAYDIQALREHISNDEGDDE